MNRPYKLTSEVEEQLQQIYRYGFQNWNQYVADEYHQGFFDTFKRIALFPKVGTPAKQYAPGLRRKKYGKHYI